MYNLTKYTPDFKNKWNDFVSKSKNGIFLFNRNYMDYHSHLFIDHSLIIQKKNKIVAIFPANEQNDQIISHGGLTYGSLITSTGIKTKEVLDIFINIIKYYRDLGFNSLLYKVIPSIFHKYPSEEDKYALYRLNAKLVRRDISSVIKLDNKIRFSETKRQSVRKCKENNIDIIENNNFEEYWSLLTNVLSKFSAKPTHTLQEISILQDRFPNLIRLFEARKKGELLAGVVIYDYTNVVHTQYMANSLEGRKIGALDYINYILIEEVYKQRNYFSFGISTEKEGKYLNEGLIQQKEMMGARGIVNDFYSISLK